MKNILVLVFYITAVAEFNGNFVQLKSVQKAKDNQVDNDEPLILTPFIEKGDINGGRSAASVAPLIGSDKSYSGYFTVDDKKKSNLFFWYFSAETNAKTAPVVLWLQGGPGCSSLFGLFYEIGPYGIVNGTDIKKRDVYWSKSMHVIFIDNPIGTGFSFSEDQSDYLKSETAIGQQLYLALIQFFTLFPELQNNGFFVAGESYAGKYVPAVSYTIDQKNPYADLKINLQGLIIGNGIIDPINQLGYSEYLFQIGLIDEAVKNKFKKVQTAIKKDILKKKYVSAYAKGVYLIYSRNSLFANVTGFHNPYNFLISDNQVPESEINSYLNKRDLKKAIHVGQRKYLVSNPVVFKHLHGDIMVSVAPWLETLADRYKVMIYEGQLDILLPYTLANNFVRKLKWCGAEQMLSAPRKQWYVKGKLAGYIKTSAPDNCDGSLSLVLVRNAGHLAPLKQPLWIYDLVHNFVK